MKAKVTRSGARIHKKNSNLSQVIGSLEIGDEIEIEAEYGRWVKLVNGGWLKAVYTEPTDLSGAGGGGGAQADWSVSDESDPACILNKPFGDGEPSTVWLDFRQMTSQETVDCPTVMDYNAEEEIPNVGATDDDRFAIEIDEDIYGEYGPNEYSTSTTLIIGNAGLYQFRYEDTGEPFCFAIEGTKVTAYFTDGGTHNVFLRKKQKINQIPKKYLPAAVAVSDAAGETPTAAEFNALLASLRAAGYLAQ